jgi:3-dehydroquinate synthetase/predicted NBD/HSP70 family sugar kinase
MYDIELIDQLLLGGFGAFQERIEGRSCLLVSTPTVWEIYGRDLKENLQARGIEIPHVLVHVSEDTKTTSQVESICRESQLHGIGREGILVAFGGGVCTDLVRVSASWVRRGIRYICIPTTLICQIDAGIGIKGAVNFHGQKSYIGSFYPPESVLIDPTFLQTLPPKHISYGVAEIIKMAIVRDEILFGLVEENIGCLRESKFRYPTEQSKEILWRSVSRMTEDLEQNIYEDKTFKRLVDFGHTFSPFIETASNFRIHHGEAVAIDMALTCAIAAEMGVLERPVRDRIVSLLVEAGLPIYTPLLTRQLCLSAFEDTMKHRGGAVNLVVPTAIGKAFFLEQSQEVSAPALRDGLRWLSGHQRGRSRRLHAQGRCLVFDIGGTTIRAAAYSAKTETVSHVISRKTPNSVEHNGNGPSDVIEKLLRQVHAMGQGVMGGVVPESVCVSFPGPLDSNNNVLGAPTIWGVNQNGPVDLCKELRRMWPYSRVRILNDVTAAGFRYLNGHDEDFCIVTVSSGIGNKVFIQGRPLVGKSGLGGEIGHLRVDFSPDAPQCDCGGIGHLGAIASGRGALKIGRRMADADPGEFSASLLGQRVQRPDKLTNEAIVAAFQSGDPWTAQLIQKVATPLGRTLATIHQGIGIMRFVIVGGFALALGEGYRTELVRSAAECSWSRHQNWDRMIVLGHPDNHSGLIGAGRYARMEAV